jgi:hypothetical protein
MPPAHKPRRPVVVDPPLAYAVARFVGRPNEQVNPLVALACISAAFPGISLDVALCGFFFRKLWLNQCPPGETLQ